MVITIWPKRSAEDKKARDGVFPSVSDSLGVFSGAPQVLTRIDAEWLSLLAA